MWVVLTILAVLIIGAGSILLYVWNGLRPASDGPAKTVKIDSGMSAFRVSDTLEQQGIIKNAFLFKYYLKVKHEGSHFQAGSYELHPGMTNSEIIAKLNAGDTIPEETVRFTIPEGYTVLQIADKLAAEGIVDKDKFLKLADEKRDWGDAEAVRSIPDDSNLHHRLEGYLFPETYEMKKGSTEEEIISRMLLETDRKLNELGEDWQSELEARKLTLHQLMTIASLIEREVVVDQERPIVASVIYNRLAKPMPLQIDATVQYLLDKPKERLMENDLKVDSPYNTYQVKSLPPGPIASPSIASIEAALHPAQTDYYYYVTIKDGSQTHLFAKTYQEHLKNIDKSNKTAG
ncbi:endolytic transglycosylase MltG [Paenibacillus protaetiae]|uniref:Endolytic murein transglycosylase n=1 Tax=Paenibacillus protaetiae TaxID=2509456 RepID=A0A4P6FCK2_9BACL|nr:endolytic transglycosylase MltG [Paenibacillus protaetiae]QAY68288.1 endolytic transglycosylase MltG [Paenibacillus protaetiae]